LGQIFQRKAEQETHSRSYQSFLGMQHLKYLEKVRLVKEQLQTGPFQQGFSGLA